MVMLQSMGKFLEKADGTFYLRHITVFIVGQCLIFCDC